MGLEILKTIILFCQIGASDTHLPTIVKFKLNCTKAIVSCYESKSYPKHEVNTLVECIKQTKIVDKK